MPEFASVSSVGQILQNMQDQAASTRERDANTQLLNIKTLIGGEEIKSIAQQRVSEQNWADYMAKQNMLAPTTDASGTLLSPRQASEQEMSPLKINAMELVKRRDKANQQLQMALADPRLKTEQTTLRMVVDNLTTQSREALNEANKADEKTADRFAGLISGVKSGQDIQETVDYVAENMGPKRAAWVASQFNKDENGQFVYDDKAQRAATRIGNSAMTVTQQLQAQNNQAIRAQAQANHEDAVAQLQIRNDQRDEDIATRRENLKLKQQEEERRAKNATRRLDLAEKKVNAVKDDPKSPEAKATARYLVAQLEMPQDLAGKAAYDFLRRKTDLMHAGADEVDADKEALEDITNNFQKGEKGNRTWVDVLTFQPGTAAKPAQYGAGGRSAAGTIKTAPAAGQYTEGQKATNPKTGEKMIYIGGRWQAVQ